MRNSGQGWVLHGAIVAACIAGYGFGLYIVFEKVVFGPHQQHHVAPLSVIYGVDPDSPSDISDTESASDYDPITGTRARDREPPRPRAFDDPSNKGGMIKVITDSGKESDRGGRRSNRKSRTGPEKWEQLREARRRRHEAQEALRKLPVGFGGNFSRSTFAALINLRYRGLIWMSSVLIMWFYIVVNVRVYGRALWDDWQRMFPSVYLRFGIGGFITFVFAAQVISNTHRMMGCHPWHRHYVEFYDYLFLGGPNPR